MSGTGDMRTPRVSSAEFKRNLWQAFSRSVRDNVVAEFAAQGLRIAGTVVLARLLWPEDFGLLRILVVVSVFAQLITEAGFPDALVQRKELTPEHEATVWWLSAGLALAAAGGLYLSAPAIAEAMAMPALTGGIRLVCVPVLLEGTSATSNARLRRRLKFRVLAAADVLSEAAFIVAAVAVVWAGYPRLSLAAGLGARLTTHGLTIWIADAYVPLVMPRLAAARELWRFAVSVLGANVAICFAANADYLLVGRLLGATALGYYSISWDLLRFVPARIHKVAVRVIFPAFSRIQDDKCEIARGYRELCSYLARVVLPFTACLVVAAPEVLRTLYGPQWTPAAVPLRLLAGGLAISGLREGMGAVYYARNRPWIDAFLNTVRLGFIVIAVISLAPAGLFGVSAGMSAIEAVTSAIGQYLACLLIGLKLWDLLVTMVPGLRLMIWCALAATAGKFAASWAGLDGVLALALIAIPPTLIFLAFERSEMNRLLAKSLERNAASAIEA